LNVALLGGTLLFVLYGSGDAEATQTTSKSEISTDTSIAANPVDQLASANIAVTVARLGRLPEATAVTNQADSQYAKLRMAATADNVVSKPQVVSTNLKSKADIQTYITNPGDTVAAIAAKFGISSDSVIWSNGLNSGSVAANQKLYIPPVNGIVYIVKSGDTAASLAEKYSASKSKIVAFNDAELGGLKPGERIVIPNGSKAVEPVYVPYVQSSFSWGSSPVYGYNGYDYGYCSWYVANKIPVPGNWGNASTWAYYAPLSGWSVSAVPRVGAIAQTPFAAGGEGHVAIVEKVSADGQSIYVSDMNGIAGWGTVGHGWQSAAKYPNYIYR
jgi:surface antigen